MDKQPDDMSEPRKRNPLNAAARTYSGPLAGVALSAVSAWMIVQGLKGLAGFELTRQTALADLLGIAIVIGVLRWIKKPGVR
jgi:hypothetical protein